MSRHSIQFNPATGIFSLSYSTIDVGGADEPTARNDVLVPDGEWTAFASPFYIEGGGAGIVLLLDSGETLEFLTHTYPPYEPIEGVEFFTFVSDQQPTMRVEHFEDGTLVYSHSLDLIEWTEKARFIPESPVVEVGLVLRYDTEDRSASAQVAQFRILPGIWQNTQEEVWIDGTAVAARVAARDVVGIQPLVNSTAEPYVHAIVGAQFGDLEFDVGKSVRWQTWFVDNLFVLDVNLGTPRYWIVNWTQTFPDAEHIVTSVNYFVVPTKFRQEQWKQYKLTYGEPYDDEWFLFVDAHEGLSVDNRSLPNDYSFAPFKSFLWREIQRAIDAGNPYAILPYYVFLRSDNITNVTYASAMDGQVDENGVPIPPILQALSVPYYLPYKGQKRLWNAKELKKPDFDWTQIDTPVDWEVRAGTNTPAVPAYLNPAVGRVSTPDPVTMPAQCVIVYKVRGPTTATADQMVVDQFGPIASPTQASYSVRRDGATGRWRIYSSGSGSSYNISNLSTIAISPNTDEEMAIAFNGGASATFQLWSKTSGTWVSQGASASLGNVPTLWNSTLPVFIGGGSDAANPWSGRIYSVEVRTGLDPNVGTVLWRFDASERTGTGTSYTDPRGRVWTLTNAAAVVPYQPAVPALPAAKAQIISYGYAHWNLQDIEPPATTVPPLTEANDDGWRMRNLLSMVRPIPGLPVGNTWVSPASDPAGLPGPWAPADANNPDPVHPTTGLPLPQPVPADPTLEGIVTPLYDCVFRINMRDGVWYEEGLSGNIPLIWDGTKWTTDYDPALWNDRGVESWDPTAVP